MPQISQLAETFASQLFWLLVTFGFVFQNFLGDNPSNAIRFAGVFLAIAGLLMLWIKEPRSVRDVDDVAHMPMAGH